MRMALRTGQDGIRSYVSLWPVTVYIVSCPCRTRYQLLFVPLGTPVGAHVHSSVIKNLFSLWGYRPIWGFASRYACGKDSLCFCFWERTLVWQSVNKWWSVTASTHWMSSVSKLFQVTEEGLNTSSRSTRPLGVMPLCLEGAIVDHMCSPTLELTVAETHFWRNREGTRSFKLASSWIECYTRPCWVQTNEEPH